jgi:hypothetical protein
MRGMCAGTVAALRSSSASGDADPILFVDPDGKKRSLLIGPDPNTNRLWTIVLSGGRDDIYYPRTCWPSKRQERRLYDEAASRQR